MIRVVLTAILLSGVLEAQAPAPPPPLAVSGMVINSTNGQPVRKVALILEAKDTENGINYEAESDGNGRFLFADIQPGEYSILTEREGFRRDEDGAPGAPLPPLKVAAGQPVKDVKVRMIQLGVITGRVLDDDGDPLRGALVSAMIYSYAGGKKDLRQVNQTMTDDNGEFRLFGLSPGKIYLHAWRRHYGSRRFVPRVTGVGGITTITMGGRVAGESATFFPSASDVAHAAPIDVAAGAQLAGFDIRLRQEAHYFIRGKLPPQFRSAEENNRGPKYMLRLFSADTTSGYPLQMDNENFTFTDIPPGSYLLMCIPIGDRSRLSARQPIEVVNSDVDGVVLSLVAPIQVSGVLRVEGTPGRSLDKLHVMLQAPAIGRRPLGTSSAEVKSDGTFTFEDVVPDIYQVTLGQHPGAYLKSAHFGDEDVTSGSIDLTKGSGRLDILLATDGGELEGTVKRPNGDPAVRVRVTLIPYGKLLGRGDLSRSGFTDDQGKFHLKNIAPGDYEIFAWEDVQVGAPQDPEFRKPFEKHAVAVKMEPNGHQSVELTSISVKAAQRADQ